MGLPLVQAISLKCYITSAACTLLTGPFCFPQPCSTQHSTGYSRKMGVKKEDLREAVHVVSPIDPLPFPFRVYICESKPVALPALHPVCKEILQWEGGGRQGKKHKDLSSHVYMVLPFPLLQ